MPYAMQCTKWNRATPYKGAYASKTYANKRDNRKPSSVEVYRPNAMGELELAVRISIKQLSA